MEKEKLSQPSKKLVNRKSAGIVCKNTELKVNGYKYKVLLTINLLLGIH